TRLEGAIPAAQRGVSRASRHHREEVQPRSYSGRPAQELSAVLLEEHPRVAAPGSAFLLCVGGRAPGRGLRRGADAAQLPGPVARLPSAARRPTVALARPLARTHRRYRGLPPSPP